MNTALSSCVIEQSSSGRAFLKKQLQLREHARIAVVKALGVSRLAADVAAMIEYREGIAVLQRARAPLLQRRGDCDRELRSRRLVDRVRGGRRIGHRSYVHGLLDHKTTCKLRFVNFSRRRHSGSRGHIAFVNKSPLTCISSGSQADRRRSERLTCVPPSITLSRGETDENCASGTAHRSRAAEIVWRHRTRRRLPDGCPG